MRPSALESFEQYASARASEGYTIVMFTGSGCPPCKAIYPVYKELVENAQSGKPSCYTLDPTSVPIPTFILYKSGAKLSSFTGADREALTNMFRRTVDLRNISTAPSFAMGSQGKKARRLST
ncbi:hypothetical protein AURDEDRAFT_170649 [Auricularia subglabra TFB-10046 SS5]|nr:hypothetical protein AURDEDRAFT_170649 [Auricularia subglabra TFB-10046 SS5]